MVFGKTLEIEGDLGDGGEPDAPLLLVAQPRVWPQLRVVDQLSREVQTLGHISLSPIRG